MFIQTHKMEFPLAIRGSRPAKNRAQKRLYAAAVSSPYMFMLHLGVYAALTVWLVSAAGASHPVQN